MRRYTLIQLDALRCIVNFGTFQAAADHLNVTQPTISLRIRELESTVGYPLLRRSGGKGELTTEGSIFYQYVERLMRTLDEMDRRTRTRDPLQGLLRLGASDTFAISCLPELLSKLEIIYPNLRVELTIRDSTSLAELLNAKLLDMAFMAEAPMEPHVRVYPLANCPLAWFGNTHQRESDAPITAAELIDRRLMTLPFNSPLNRIMVRWFEASNQPIPPFSICNSLAMVLRLTNASLAWSILPVCFALSNETSILPAPIKVTPDLPTLRLCSAHLIEGPADTLAPVVELLKEIILHKPGLIPLK